MATDCIIENLVKKNKSWLGFLLAIIVVWFLSMVGIITIKHYCMDLPWQNSRISLSNLLSLGSAIGAIAVAVFAWMAYKYATEQYMKNEKEKHIYTKKYDSICEIMDYIYSLYIDLLEIETAYNDLKNATNKIKNITSEITRLEERLYINCDKRTFKFGSLLFNNNTLMKILINEQEQKTIRQMLLAIQNLNSSFLASNPKKIYIPLNKIMVDKNLMRERIDQNISYLKTHRESAVKVSNKFIELVQTEKLLN